MKRDRRIVEACCAIPRRSFLADCGMGFTGLALGAMLHRDGVARAATAEPWAPPDGKPHFAPKAKSVIWLFMIGGASHVEGFDPKPALNRYGGQTIGDTPYKEALVSPYLKKNVKGDARGNESRLFPMQVGFQKRGKSGIEVSDWWPSVGACVDDMAIVRSMWTTDDNHGAQLQFHTGRLKLEGYFPTIGSWAHYGLGSLNDNLPQFVVLGDGPADCCGGMGTYDANYLGPEHSGVPLRVDAAHPLPFAAPSGKIYREEQEKEFGLIRRLNGLAAVEYPEDAAMRARIKSYELAFRMQMAVPEVMDLSRESAETRKLYGIDRLGDGFEGRFAKQCLLARRFVEGGTRFIQIHHGAGGAGAWDSHSELKKNHSKLANQVDQPIAGLIKDLKQRGLFDSTLIVFATEFGRTPGLETAEIQAGTREGRDHHPFGFSVFLAGGGIKGGVVHGATDELGWHAVQDRHYVTDVHATIMHQLGLVPSRLDLPGRKRIDKDYGEPIRAIMT
jgi:hypothetical protein